MIEISKVQKVYRTDEVETFALNNISLQIEAGEFVAIMGPSGCGKSTLLNILGLLDTPTEGQYQFFGHHIGGASEGRLTQLRRSMTGFVFQSFNLINELTVFENVEVGLLYRGAPATERRRRATEALEQVGMSHRARHRPQQLSGGQQQRVAIARAMVGDPKVILADEPTGNLDTTNGETVMDLLKELNARGATIIMVTHSLPHASMAKRTIRLLDGRVVSETVVSQ